MRSLEDLATLWKRELADPDPGPLRPMLAASRFAAVVDAFHEQVLAPFEIDRGEYEVLSALRRAGAPHRASPSALMRAVGCSSAGIAKRSKKLEAAGFVERSSDPEDGRGALITLSRRGLELQERIFRAHLSAMESRLEGLDEAERRELADTLWRLAGLVER